MNSTQQFVFSVAESEAPVFISEINDWIKLRLSLRRDAEGLLFNCRLILAELVANAIQHSAVQAVIFECEVNETAITIKKMEQGKRFFLLDRLQNGFFADIHSEKITLAKDKRFGLFALIRTDSLIEFQIEEYLDNENQAHGSLEHFGLIIITKCTHKFTYEFDHTTLTNTFIAKIKL